MNKGLETLENICNQCEHYQFEKGLRPKKCPFNKSCVFKQRIEKSLKALEIIKKKTINIPAIVIGHRTLEEYNLDAWDFWDIPELTQEEYDLLKEVLL